MVLDGDGDGDVNPARRPQHDARSSPHDARSSPHDARSSPHAVNTALDWIGLYATCGHVAVAVEDHVSVNVNAWAARQSS